MSSLRFEYKSKVLLKCTANLSSDQINKELFFWYLSGLYAMIQLFHKLIISGAMLLVQNSDSSKMYTVIRNFNLL